MQVTLQKPIVESSLLAAMKLTGRLRARTVHDWTQTIKEVEKPKVEEQSVNTGHSIARSISRKIFSTQTLYPYSYDTFANNLVSKNAFHIANKTALYDKLQNLYLGNLLSQQLALPQREATQAKNKLDALAQEEHSLSEAELKHIQAVASALIEKVENSGIGILKEKISLQGRTFHVYAIRGEDGTVESYAKISKISLGSGTFKVAYKVLNMTKRHFEVMIKPKNEFKGWAKGWQSLDNTEASIENIKKDYQTSVDLRNKGVRHIAQPKAFQPYKIDHNSDSPTATRAVYINELCTGDLEARIKENRISEQERMKWAQQLCESVYDMHTKATSVHQDLKPANVLIGQDGNIRVNDFDFVVDLTTPQIEQQTCGTPFYMPPEIFKNQREQYQQGRQPYTAFDAWSVGCILYQMKYPSTNPDTPTPGSQALNTYWEHQDMDDTLYTKMVEQITAVRDQLHDDVPYDKVVKGLLDPNEKTRMTLQTAVLLLGGSLKLPH